MLHIIILCCVVLLLPLLCFVSAPSSLDERVVKTFYEAFARIYTVVATVRANFASPELGMLSCSSPNPISSF